VESVFWSVSKLSTESVGSRRQLVADCVHTADATNLDSFVASASVVSIGLKISKSERNIFEIDSSCILGNRSRELWFINFRDLDVRLDLSGAGVPQKNLIVKI